jgi:hypothetical protein
MQGGITGVNSSTVDSWIYRIDRIHLANSILNILPIDV